MARSAHLSRRGFLLSSAMGASAATVGLLGGPALAVADPWQQADDIVARIKPPTFPNRDFIITRYGAVGDGRKICTTAIKSAIQACAKAGGGRVIVPSGVFLTGPIRLLNNVNLRLQAGATLRFVTNPDAYLPPVLTRWQGSDLYNYRPFIYAYQRRNVAITGSGTLDGQASNAHWWPWSCNPDFGHRTGISCQFAGTPRLRQQREAGVPVSQRIYGKGDNLRPSMIQPYGCTNVLIEGVTIRNAPMWVVHPVFCANVTIRKITVDSDGPNNDGVDVDSCDHVLVEDCTFAQRDDKVAIKSGMGRDGVIGAPGTPYGTRPATNIVVRNCRVREAPGAALAIGSEMGGGIANVFAENMTNLAGEPGISLAFLLKSSTYRGGTARNIWVRDFNIASCSLNAITITYLYDQDDLNGPYRPRFENVNLTRLNVGRSKLALYALGSRSANLPIVDLRLRDCTFRNCEKSFIRVDCATDLVLDNVLVNGKRPVVNGTVC